MHSTEEFRGLVLDTRCFFPVKIEPDFTPVQIAPTARKPEIINTAGPLLFKYDVLSFIIDIEL